MPEGENIASLVGEKIAPMVEETFVNVGKNELDRAQGTIETSKETSQVGNQSPIDNHSVSMGGDLETVTHTSEGE